MTHRVAFLVKKSAYASLSTEQSAHVGRLIERQDPTVARLESTHAAHTDAVTAVIGALKRLGCELHEVHPGEEDITRDRFSLMVTIGGDGTLLRGSHLVRDVPMLGVNSAPQSSVGFFCGIKAGPDLEAGLAAALHGSLDGPVLSRMVVTKNDAVVSARVLNDALFCHLSPAATSRYLIALGAIAEEHKSSGLWIGPAAGSTAAQRSAGGDVLDLTSPELQLVVREAYTPQGESLRLMKCRIAPGQVLEVRSKMRESAMFLDGPDLEVRVEFGDVLTFRRSEESLRILGIGGHRQSDG